MLRYLALILGMLTVFLPACSSASAGEGGGECAVVLHGLGRTARSMDEMAEALRRNGYAVANLDYESRDHRVEVLAMSVIPEGLAYCRSRHSGTIHFVTHSLGGILLRYYLSVRPIDRLGRTVMLSPPNRGSEVVDALRDQFWYRWYNGPAGQQLGTKADSLPLQLGAVDFPVGIITGNVHSFFDFWLADLIPGPDDGKVSVERAKVAGMTDFLVVPASHPFIMNDEQVIDQTLHFLEHGSFQHPGASTEVRVSTEK